MNVFWHELRVHRMRTLIWALSVFVFMIISMAKYEAISAQGGAMVNSLLKTMPSTVQAVFGMSGLDLVTIGGYFAVCYLLLAVILAVHAGLAGAGVLAEEESDRTTEFLYVRPRSRRAIVTAKLAAGTVVVGIIWMSAVAGSITGIMKFAKFGDFTPDFWRLMAAAAIIQLVFFSVGVFAAAASKKAVLFGRIVSIAIFGSYLLYVVGKLSPHFAWVHYISIFSWFDAADILNTHALKLHYVVTALIISFTLLVVGLIMYNRRDLRV